MTSDLEKLMANLSDSERDRLKGAFAADPELAQGLSTMLADLPPDTQAQLMRRLAASDTAARSSARASRLPRAACGGTHDHEVGIAARAGASGRRLRRVAETERSRWQPPRQLDPEKQRGSPLPLRQPYP